MKTVVELFISEYFSIKTILGTYLKDEKTLFSSLSKVFLIPDSDVDKLYRLAENEVARKINTENDFLTYQRMQKYFMLSDMSDELNSEYDEIARIKGNTILSAQKNKLFSDNDATKNTIYNDILLALSEGSLEAMRIMGILQCEGIFVAKNKKLGFNYLSKSASWNDLASTLALLYYFDKNRAYNMQRLFQIVTGTPFEELYFLATKVYGKQSHDKIHEIDLLEYAFESGVVKREVFESVYSRILGSSALSIKEKEKALLSQNKELLSTINDLPLNLSAENVVRFDTSKIKESALKREAEQEKVERILKNSDLRGLPSFRPLCLCCDSKYVLNSYAKAISAKSTDTHVELIDVSVLTEYDLNPAQNNVFVRNIDEDKDNRLLLFFFGEISKAKIEVIKNILLPDYRAKFHLANPNVTLNLSSVLPICFTDEKNSHLLKPYCDVVKLSALAEGEKVIALKDILKEKEIVYGINKINVDDKTLNLICEYDLDIINGIIDAVIRLHRQTGKDIDLTQDILLPLLSDFSTPRIGFGGRQ